MGPKKVHFGAILSPNSTLCLPALVRGAGRTRARRFAEAAWIAGGRHDATVRQADRAPVGRSNCRAALNLFGVSGPLILVLGERDRLVALTADVR